MDKRANSAQLPVRPGHLLVGGERSPPAGTSAAILLEDQVTGDVEMTLLCLDCNDAMIIYRGKGMRQV